MIYPTLRNLTHLLVATSLLALVSCKSGGGSGDGGGGAPAPAPIIVAPVPAPIGSIAVLKSVTISWPQNKETIVNRAGGGYRVYISYNSGFNIGDAGVFRIVDVAFNGTLTPTTVMTNLLSNPAYYVKITSYGIVIKDGSSQEVSSQLSSQQQFSVAFDIAP